MVAHYVITAILVMKRTSINMISTLKPRFRQYKTAWFVKEGEDVNKRKPFRYTIVNEAEKAYSQVVRNLVSTRNSFVIQTNYMFDFEIGDLIFTDRACNNKWKVNNRAKITHKQNEQALGTLKNNPATFWVLDLA